MKRITERQVIATWYTPEEKLPPEGMFVLVTVSGKDGGAIYDHTLQIADYFDNGGWLVEGFSDDAQFEIHAWCDIDPYDFKEGGITWTN